NAKCESISSLPSFRDAYKRCRCLLLIDNFFEWRAIKGDSKTAVRHRHDKSGEHSPSIWEKLAPTENGRARAHVRGQSKNPAPLQSPVSHRKNRLVLGVRHMIDARSTLAEGESLCPHRQPQPAPRRRPSPCVSSPRPFPTPTNCRRSRSSASSTTWLAQSKSI